LAFTDRFHGCPADLLFKALAGIPQFLGVWGLLGGLLGSFMAIEGDLKPF
jgi:hypothetical protein